ncbi:MAG: peptidase [Burkholderiales bacterium]|jgi:STE24 endopeptidase|nr:peptidase [Burkholderiales bacterium]
MSLLSQGFLAIVILVTLMKLYLASRQMKAIKTNINQVPASFSQSISLSDHQKAANYNLAKLRLGNLELVFGTIILLLFTLGGGIEFINTKLNNVMTTGTLSYGVAVIAAFTVINAIINMPFSLYSTFGIEQKFGFNKITVKLFIIDLIKTTLLSCILGIPFLYLVLWLMAIMGNFWWLWVWVAFVIFNVLMLLIYPTFIAPIFNKFTPLSDIDLKVRIDNLLTKCGFQSRGVFVMDGSKRSSHGNAYFTGIGKSKRIVFFDTLIKQLNHVEIEAVLAHELGHFKRKHVLKQMIVSFVMALIALYILGLLIDSQTFYNALGVSTVNNANGLLLFMLVLGVVTFPLAPLSSYFSRKNEFEADAFAKEHANKDDLISGLVKMYKDNASTLTPDELYVKFYYSHPPASVRIAHLQAGS